MAMGKKPAARQASPMWVTTADLPTNAGHPFFERLNRVLEEAGFDAFVEGLCAAFYAARMGRPSLRPGRYFRLLFIGYFEGLSSERGIDQVRQCARFLAVANGPVFGFPPLTPCDRFRRAADDIDAAGTLGPRDAENDGGVDSVSRDSGGEHTVARPRITPTRHVGLGVG